MTASALRMSRKSKLGESKTSFDLAVRVLLLFLLSLNVLACLDNDNSPWLVDLVVVAFADASGPPSRRTTRPAARVAPTPSRKLDTRSDKELFLLLLDMSLYGCRHFSICHRIRRRLENNGEWLWFHRKTSLHRIGSGAPSATDTQQRNERKCHNVSKIHLSFRGATPCRKKKTHRELKRITWR